MSEEALIVSISLGGENIRVGKIWAHVKNRKESASFKYDEMWLNHPEKFALDPALSLSEGTFHTGHGESLFSAMGDSSPDRWGRVLMRRAEISSAKKEHRTPRTLFEIDYFLGVNDESRQGALRFSLSSDEDLFLASKRKHAIPPLVDLPDLLSATERFIEDKESADDLMLLLLPGSSLGGARPKACVREKDNSLAIAKFPRKDDEHNVVIWEAVALALAKKAGINVPQNRIEMIQSKPVLIISRFDRRCQERIPFLSAMSMLSAADNEPHSYLEIAYALAKFGACPDVDMKELWRRLVFTIMVANTDDHLRNHGFLFERYKGWRLSPAYDINPTPIDMAPRVLTTSIDFYDNHASLETAINVSKEFRLQKKEAILIIREVAEAVNQWRKVACDFGLSQRDCDRMASAFVIDCI